MGSSEKIVSGFRFLNSKNDNLIQLADMVAGSIYQAHSSLHPDSGNCLNLLKPRIEDIWKFK